MLDTNSQHNLSMQYRIKLIIALSCTGKPNRNTNHETHQGKKELIIILLTFSEYELHKHCYKIILDDTWGIGVRPREPDPVHFILNLSLVSIEVTIFMCFSYQFLKLCK